MTSKLRLALLLPLLAGCGGPPESQIRGTVTLDGKPVKAGAIEFFPTGAGGRSAGAAITDGNYQATGTPGAMKVTVYSAEVVGKQKMYDTPDSPVEDIVKNNIPARYNTASELTADLKDGDNQLDFDLTSKAK